MDFLKNENFNIQHLNPLTTRRLGKDRLIAGGPGYIVVHDTGILGFQAADYVDRLKQNHGDDIDMAHLVVDDLQIIECVPVFDGKPEQLEHVNFTDMVDLHFLGGEPNKKAISVMYCYGGNINVDKAYLKLVKCLAYTCFKFKLPPRFCCVGHQFLDPKHQIDPVRGLSYGRKSYDQLMEDVLQVYGELNELKAKTAIIQTFKNPIIIRTSFRVNLREKRPSTLSKLVKVIPPETDVLCKGWTLEGDAINGNSLWLQGTSNNFFWSGAIDQPVFNQWLPDDISFPSKLVDWSKRCPELPTEWLQTQGDGVRIVIIDSGVDIDHPNLAHIPDTHRKGASTIENPVEDVEGHGTHCSGIINARSFFEKGISGIAPKAEVFVFKARDDSVGYNSKRVKEGIEWAKEKKAHIISMSIESDGSEVLDNEFEALFNENILLVAAAGNNQELLKNKILYPAFNPHCIAVGTIDESTYLNDILPLYDQGNAEKLEVVNFVLPLFKMTSCFKTKVTGNQKPYFEKLEGSSMATAFMSGAFALLLSHLKQNEGIDQMSIPDLINRMHQHSTPLESEFNPMRDFIHIYNPKKLIQ